MCYLMAPNPPAEEIPVFFNVEGVVGAAPAKNLREDTLLVQFFLTLVARKPTSSPDLAAACMAVRPTGVIDPATVNAIVVLQRNSPYKNTLVDGRISPATEQGFYSATAPWTIIRLNQKVQNDNTTTWPRIDMIGGCPAELVQMVKKKVGGI